MLTVVGAPYWASIPKFRIAAASAKKMLAESVTERSSAEFTRPESANIVLRQEFFGWPVDCLP